MLLTVKEVAERLRVSEKTVRNMIDRGDLIAYKIGGNIRIEEESVEFIIEEGKIEKATFWRD